MIETIVANVDERDLADRMMVDLRRRGIPAVVAPDEDDMPGLEGEACWTVRVRKADAQRARLVIDRLLGRPLFRAEDGTLQHSIQVLPTDAP